MSMKSRLQALYLFHIQCQAKESACVAAGKYDPCIDFEVTKYFNRPDVQKAFHANDSEHRLPWAWEGCSTRVIYSRSITLPNEQCGDCGGF